MSVNRYNRIKTIVIRSNTKFKTHIPKPISSDYNVGYIVRYFIQKANDKGSPIYEVNHLTFRKMQSNVDYQAIRLRWRIFGSKTEKYDVEGNQIDKGVSVSNSIAIKNKSHLIPNLKLYLPNLLQFYKS
jgi:hypothetical protein